MMDPEKFADKLKNDEGNDDYIGNIWGWKFSIFGLFLILIMSALTFHSYKTGRLDMTTGEPMNKAKQETAKPDRQQPLSDSLKLPK